MLDILLNILLIGLFYRLFLFCAEGVELFIGHAIDLIITSIYLIAKVFSFIGGKR